MAFEKSAWDPTPAQFSAFAVVVSWSAAYLIENFIQETDVSGYLRLIFSALTGKGSLDLIWSPIALGFVAPFLMLWGAMMLDRKNLKFKRGVLFAGIVGLTSFLVVVDLKLSLF